MNQFQRQYWLSIGFGIWLSWQSGGAAMTMDNRFSAGSNLLTKGQEIQLQHPLRENPPHLAQLFFPPADQKPILRVIGKGRAAQPADTAKLVFEFSLSDTTPSLDEPSDPSSGSTSDPSLEPPPAPPYSYKRQRQKLSGQRYKATPSGPDKSKLQPVLDALKKVGVTEQNMSIKSRDAKGSSPFPFPFPSTGKVTSSGLDLTVTQEKPSQTRLQELARTVETTVEQSDALSLNRTGVTYTVNDCRNLEAQVYRSAGEEAMQRATAMASSMGAKLNPVPSISQPIYDLIYPPCRSGKPFPFKDGDSDFGPESVPEVVLSREIFVTFTLKRK